jgi:hypothetical protein
LFETLGWRRAASEALPASLREGVARPLRFRNPRGSPPFPFQRSRANGGNPNKAADLSGARRHGMALLDALFAPVLLSRNSA